MKTAIVVLLLSAVSASDSKKLEKHEYILRTAKASNADQIVRNESAFANAFKLLFLKDENVKVEATKERIENYVPKIETFQNSAECLDDYFIKIFKLNELFKNILFPNRCKLKQNNDIVPGFKVTYDGKELKDDERNKLLSHNDMDYELAHCSICTDYCQNPKIICGNKHSFCEDCLDTMFKSSEGIKSCPNCRDVYEEGTESGKSLTPELQIHLCNKVALIRAQSRAVIYFFFMALSYLLGLNSVGFAFQTFGALMVSFAPVPLYRIFRGEQIQSVRATGDQKAMLAVLGASMLTNFVLGIFTIGGWSTLFGFILLFPLVKLLQLNIFKKKDE